MIFSGAAGIVTLNSNITSNSSVRFSTDGYVINRANGFVLNIAPGFFTVDAGLKATINAPIAGSALTKSGEELSFFPATTLTR